MSRRHISQREAHATEKLLRALQEAEQLRRRKYASEYPGGVHLATIRLDAGDTRGRIEGAQMLGCALVAKLSDGDMRIFALPREAQP